MKDRKWGLPPGCPVLILVFSLALSSAFSSYGQSTVVARTAGVTGQAILLTPGLAPLALTAGYILSPGDRIDTRGGGRVVIDLSDGSMVVVSPESVVTLKDYRAAASLRELFGITLGMVRVKINHFAGKPNPYRMNSPTASIAVRGTEFSIEVDAEGATQVVVYEGAVEVASLTDPDRRVLIEAGRGVLVQGGQDFHLIGAIPPQPGNRDAGDRNAPPERAKPVQLANARGPDGHSDGPQPPGAGTPPPPPQGPIPQAHAEHDRDDTPRACASTYDRYLAGLADIAQVPFLFRFNAFPEAHLDSLENPAYATEFRSAEGRLFVLPTFRGARTLQEYRSALGPGGSLPSDYSISPQVSYFAPAGAFTFGGSASISRVGNTTLTAVPDYEPGSLDHNPQSAPQTSGSSSGTFYSAALVAARHFGANSLGVELATLKGTGSISSVSTEPMGYGRVNQERSLSTSDISQTRLTAGFSRDLTRDMKLGVFY
ncbi:MAG TPA: FecR family protein, partial [Acetobacteraceae bacterium]|nr:FecR family protein [Acetobacteraceae bacterium]